MIFKLMIQDIFPKQYHVEYKNIAPELSDKVLAFTEGKVLLKTDTDELVFPEVKDLDIDLTYAFSIDDEHFFLATEKVDLLGFEYCDLRSQMFKGPTHYAFAIITGRHLNTWYTDNVYCGRCGHRTEHDDRERMLRCKNCGNQIFPKICPAVIVGVINDDKLLVTKYAQGYGGTALVAGFCEIGETVEDTVRREVLEETGLNVKNFRYYKSQPWGIVSDLLIGVFCEVDGEPKISLDDHELKEASFKTREELPDFDNNPSLTGEMITVFKGGLL